MQQPSDPASPKLAPMGASEANSSLATGQALGHCAGRETELAALLSHYEQARVGGRPRLVLVEGPSGIGKSDILSEFQSRVRLQGGVVLEGHCEEGKAYGPFAQIVDSALRFLGEVGVTPRCELSDLACRGGCHALWHHHGGPEAERIPFQTKDVPGATSETAVFEKRLRFFDAIGALLAEVAQVRAPIMVLSSLERADRGTLDLLKFLLDGVNIGRGDEETGLFLGSLHTGSWNHQGGLAPLVAHTQTTRVEIGVLDQAGVAAYLQSPRTLARVMERTGGVPEAIDLLLEGDPLTTDARFLRRKDALPPAASRLVEALAVLHRPATLEQLSFVAAAQPTLGEMEALSATGLLNRSLVNQEVVYTFVRDADGDVCRTMLDDDARRMLHRRCAQLSAESTEMQEAVRHALAAGDAREASDLTVVAAASLSARHAHGEAAALLESLLEALGDKCPVAIRGQLTELYRVSGDYQRALVHARELAASENATCTAQLRLGQLLTVAGLHGEAKPVLLLAQELASEEPDSWTLAEVEAQLAELHYQVAEHEEAHCRAESALNAALQAERITVEIQARNTLGKLALAQKEPETAAEYFEVNRDKAQHRGLGHQEAQAHTNLGVAMLLSRNLAGAEAACHQAIEVATRSNDTRERAIATENLAVLAHLGRDYSTALEHYRHAVSLLKRLGNQAMLARVAHNLGELYYSIGEQRQARSLCDFAAHLSVVHPSVQGEGLLLRGRVEAADGNVVAARQAFAQARDLFEGLRSPRYTEASLELARLALVDGDIVAARAILGSLPGQKSAKRLADVALVAAEIERAAGGEIVTASRRAVELAEAADDGELLLPALIRYARALGDQGEIGLATRILEKAQSLEESLRSRVPEECQAAWDERAVRAELARVISSLTHAWTRTRPESVPPPPSLRSAPPPPIAKAIPRDPRFAQWRKRYPEIVGTSSALAPMFDGLDKVSKADVLVLVRGESGTGKELVAQAIHDHSPRRHKALVKVNCAALVETLLMSELFGHEKGAFTGASSRRKGRFELANGGTLFLDEIGDISPKTQVALLRVLQEREFERVGGTTPIKVDVRIIAATHRDLEKMVSEGTFREDLYYRLRGVTLRMPALRDRLEDIGVLSSRLLARIAENRGEPPKSLSRSAIEALRRHDWRGNVRELENVLRSATLFSDVRVLDATDFEGFSSNFGSQSELPAAPLPHTAPGPNATQPLEALLYERVRGGETSLLEIKKLMERECIVRALEETEGNITQAASLLGMKRPRLSQLVKQYDLQTKKRKV